MHISEGAAASGARARSVDAEINLVPFIDMMSCIVAFLLLTAAWSAVAQLRADVAHGGHEAAPARAAAAVLLTVGGVEIATADDVRLRVVVGDPAALRAALAGVAATNVELSAEPGVSYARVVNAMDEALDAGATGVTWVDPSALTPRLAR